MDLVDAVYLQEHYRKQVFGINKRYVAQLGWRRYLQMYTSYIQRTM